MKYLVFNVGSYCVKWKVFDEELRIVDKGYREEDFYVGDVLDKYKKEKVIIGHRVVHGGWKYFRPTVLSSEVVSYLEEVSYLAPLHNPCEVKVIKDCKEYMTEVVNVGFFDTGFFEKLPDRSKIYGINWQVGEKYGLRRFGFHGTSHQYLSEKGGVESDKSINKINQITIHLGAGCSVTAIEGGKAIDTSFGFTPLEGVMMAKRSGDIDPGVVFYLINKAGMSIIEVEKLLTEKSGLMGFCGTDDMRVVLKRLENGDERARLAVDVFCYRVRKYIGSYWAVLNGKVDQIIFSGGIGFGSEVIRQKILDGLLKSLKKTQILVMETDEETVIGKCLKEFK